MFWFVFISIILFILFLIVLLISSDSSGISRPRRVKEERKTKTSAREKAAATPRRTKTEAEREPQPYGRATIEDTVVATAAAEEIAVAVTAEPAPAEEEDSASRELSEVDAFAGTQESQNIAFDEPFILEEEPFFEESAAAFETEREEITEAPAAAFELVEETPEPLFETDVFTAEKTEQAPEAPTEEIAETVVEAAAAEAVIEAVPVEVEEPYDYPPFDNTRAMEEFGLPKEEADLFIVDLIEQVEGELPGLEAAVAAQDSKRVEDISHMIKGSATNLGTGGIADVLIDFNTYMKGADEPSVIAKHMRNLHHALKELKLQYQ